MRGLILAAGLTLCGTAQAGPATLAYEAQVVDADGKPVNGAAMISIEMSDASTGPAPLWSAMAATTANQGQVALLGQDPFPPELVNSPLVNLQLTANGVPQGAARRVGSALTTVGAAICDNVTGDFTPSSLAIGGVAVIDAMGRWVGPSGPAGPAGANGSSVIGASEAPGANCPGGGIRLMTATTSHFICNGAAGLTGPAGALGPQGPAGAPGTGGAIGPTGPQGTQGPAGVQGPAGSPGSPGTIGLSGLVGAQGPAGPVGPAGNAYNAGPPRGPQTTTLDSQGITGQHAAITIGVGGLPIISYYDQTNGDLRVAKCTNSICAGPTLSTVDFGTTDTGQFSSITLSPLDGYPIISYYDVTNTRLMVAKCVDHACTGAATITQIDPGTTDTGRFTSITIADDGLPIVSYHDVSNGGLKVAKCTNAACTASSTTVVDATAGRGSFSSIAIGAEKAVYVAYLDATAQQVQLVRCGDATCSSGNILSPPFGTTVQGNISLAIGDDGLPIVSYRAAGNLSVTHCGDTACSASLTNQVDANGDEATSIAVAPDGLPIIAWHRTGGGMAIVKCATADCATGVNVVLSGSGLSGSSAAITIGADGVPLIASYNGTAAVENLEFTRCSNPFCTPFWRQR